MLLAAVVLCAWAGLGALAFSMDRHYARVCGWKVLRRQQVVLRASGSGLLALALAAAMVRDGVSFGALLWVALLGVIGTALVLLLAYRPRTVFITCGAQALSRWAARAPR
jgi:hypothetical protein